MCKDNGNLGEICIKYVYLFCICESICTFARDHQNSWEKELLSSQPAVGTLCERKMANVLSANSKGVCEPRASKVLTL